MANVYNFFKFLEDKADRRVPLRLKLLNDPESITEKDLYVKGTLDLENTNIEILPDNLALPCVIIISPIIAETKLDLPDPVEPIIAITFPFWGSITATKLVVQMFE